VAEFERLQTTLVTTSLGKYKEVKQRDSSFKVSTGGPESLPPLLRGTKHKGSASSSAGGPSVVEIKRRSLTLTLRAGQRKHRLRRS